MREREKESTYIYSFIWFFGGINIKFNTYIYNNTCVLYMLQLKKELEAKAAGLQFIPASKLQEKVKAGASDEDQEEDEEDSEEDEDESNMFRGVAYRKKEEDLVYTGKAWY